MLAILRTWLLGGVGGLSMESVTLMAAAAVGLTRSTMSIGFPSLFPEREEEDGGGGGAGRRRRLFVTSN